MIRLLRTYRLVSFMPMLRLGTAVVGFFGLKVLVGLLLVSTSAHHLSVSGFATFSQLFLFLALLSSISGGGVQGGLTRQIAVARGRLEDERRATTAALAVSAAFGAAFILAAALFGAPLSRMLIGSPMLARPLLWVALTTIVGGFGSVLGAVLTGRGRAPLGLTCQGAGLLVSGAACFAALRAGDPTGAVLGYAAGPVVTTVLILPAAADALPWFGRGIANVRSEARLLLHYSGASVAIVATMPAALFGLRYVYRAEFGSEALGYWLAANRVSDVTSQLLGLYMGQIFLPQMARAESASAARRIGMATLVLGTAVMGLGWAAFESGAQFFVRTFFSEKFLPAIPFIGGYLLGDTLRVSGSAASSAAAARGRPFLCVAIEAAGACLLAVYMLPLIAMHRPDAAWLGYLLAQGTMTAVVATLLIRSRPASANRLKK